MSSDEFSYTSTLKDELAAFFNDPSKSSFIDIVDYIEEKDYLECKEEWIESGELARHILALANTEGGAIIVGISQNDDGTLEPTGLEDLRDSARLGDKIKKYIPDSLRSQYELQDYVYTADAYPNVAGKKFQVIFIETNNFEIPYISMGAMTGIKSDTIYIRRDTQSTKANHSEIEDLIRRRLRSVEESTSRELSEEIDELEMLYGKLDKKWSYSRAISGSISTAMTVDNPYYPDESFDDFVRKLVFKKKIRIERVLGVEDIGVKKISPNDDEE